MTSLTKFMGLADAYGTLTNPMTAFYLMKKEGTITPSNNSILDQLNANGVENGNFFTINGRTSAGTADYDALIAKGWNLLGLDLASNPTFITAQSVGQNINIYAETSTGYWKYNHNGSDSSVFSNSNQTTTVANANGEFTIIPCLSDGTVSGDITTLYLSNNQLTSFDGTGLTSLAYLYLSNNQLTSFDGTDLTSLTQLYLENNQLTSFDPTGLTSLTNLGLYDNQLTSFDGTGLSSLTTLFLENNQLTSFDGTDLSSLTQLYLTSNQLTSFDGTDLTSLTELDLQGNQLTSFDGTGLTSLTNLILPGNLLTSLDVSPMVSLQSLYLSDSYGTLTNPMTAASNNSILSQLDNNGVENGGLLIQSMVEHPLEQQITMH
jgi:Leucine-rich repeat (LRR) protein